MTYWIVGGIVLAVIAVIAAYSYGRYHPDPDMVGIDRTNQTGNR